MQKINLYSIPPLLCGVLIFAAGIYILSKNYKSPKNKAFFKCCLVSSIWLSFYSINYLLSNLSYDLALINWIFRIAYCGVAFISIFFFEYILIFLELNWAKKWIIFNNIYGIIISLLIIKTNLIVKGLKHFFWGLYPIAGPLHPFFLFYFFLLVSSSTLFLIREILINRLPSSRLNQIKYLLLAFLIFTLACFDFVPNYGIELYPIGYIPATLFVLIITYAIIKHQLMEIHIVIKKSITYSFLIAIITTIYLMLVVVTEKILQEMVGYKSIILSVTTAFTLGIVLIPLKNKIQHLVDKHFFQGTHEEISQQNEQLIQEVAQTEKYKTLAAISSGIAHEIRNPLTAILTFTEHLPEKLDDKEFLKKFSKIVGKETIRIKDMVQELMDYARPHPPAMKPTNIHKLLKDTIEFINTNFVEHNIETHYDLCPNDLAVLNIDPNQFRQAIFNILLNAIDAMPGGGKLTVTTKVAGHRVQGSGDGSVNKTLHPVPLPLSAIQIIIRDTGVGIDAADLPHIFDPFFSKKDNGTGLGLAITQSIIEQHKGKIKVRSQVGVGTEFVIEMPIRSS